MHESIGYESATGYVGCSGMCSQGRSKCEAACAERRREIETARRAGSGMTLEAMAAEAFNEQGGWPRGMLVAVVFMFACVAAGSLVAWGLQ